MPKIKVKNILSSTEERICNTHPCGSKCPLYAHEATVVNDYDFTIEHITCIRDARYNQEETIVELSEKDFPTNREWLESLSDEDLALFMRAYGFGDQPSKTIEEWLSKPCVYLIEREEE